MNNKFFLLFLLITLSASALIAQNITINGTVLSEEDGEPLIGVTVTVKGNPSVGASTDIDGKFNLTVSSSVKVLVFSYVGMVTQELPVKPEMNVSLAPQSFQMKEVVVTGIGKMDKRLFTGATDKIDASETKLDGLPDVSRALEGRSAGVSVQNVSGTFGTAPKIRVRGATSIYGASKPLWVVDGVVVESLTDVNASDLSSGDAVTLISSAIAGLNSEDIESFQILKDGSATSIYGARAMAGVIVITTKQGKPGVSSLNYTGEFTYRMKPSYNEFNIMNSQDQMGIYKEMEEKGWLNFAESYRQKTSGIYGKMYRLIDTYDPITGTYALENTLEAKSRYLQAAEMRNTDWFDVLFNSNIMQSHSFSASSGNDKSSYYASLSAMFDPGWTKQSNLERYTGNFNVNYNILKNLSLNMISMGSYRKQKAPGTLGQSLEVVSGNVSREFDINPYSYALNSSRALSPNEYYTMNYSPFNILQELENNNMSIDVSDFKFQGELKWRVLKKIELSGLAAYNFKFSSQTHDTKDFSNQALAYRMMDDATIRDLNTYLYTDPVNPYALPQTVLPEGGFYQLTDYKMQSLDSRFTVSYVDEFAEKHLINFYGGAENNRTQRVNTWFNGVGMKYSDGEVPFFKYEYFKKLKETGGNYYSKSSNLGIMAAFFGSLTYSYKAKYALNLTGRYEGSNQMGRSKTARWLPTWNVGLSWNVHDEAFFKSIEDVFSHLRLKTSYSLTGDKVPSSISNSSIIIKNYEPYRPFTDVQETGLQIYEHENSELTYEKKHEFNAGAEMGFLKNRINFAFDVYRRNNFDLIGLINTQGIGGSVLKYANVADMKSHGLEFTLTTQNINKKDFNWTTNFILGQAVTKITRLDGINRAIDLVTGTGSNMEGYPVNSLFSYKFEGLDENGAPKILEYGGIVSDMKTGQGIAFQNRDNLLEYLKHEGPTDPPITGSLGNIFRYKNFRLNVFVTYAFGNVVRLDDIFSAKYTDLVATTREFKNRWVIPGDENYTNIPAILSSAQLATKENETSQLYVAYNYSDARVAKGDFIRMKEISLSYDIPVAKISAIEALSVKLQGTNLFLLYADKKLNGQDPEFIRSGGVAVPIPKQFTLTLRASF